MVKQPRKIKRTRKSKITERDRWLTYLQSTDTVRYEKEAGIPDTTEIVQRRLEEEQQSLKRKAGTSSQQYVNINPYDGPVFRVTRMPKKSKTSNQYWGAHSPSIKSWFCEASSFGEPDPTLKVPRELEPLSCSCEKQRSKINVFMLHNVCQINVEHCQCRPLVHALILMQVFPSSTKDPESGCHFALLDFLHLIKTNARMSNHAFTNILNQHLLNLNKYDECHKISEFTLNFTYQFYRKTIHHVTGLEDATTTF